MRPLRACAIAALSVTIALLLTLAIPPMRQQFKFVLFVPAVFVSAIGGFWPGVFATLLSLALADYFLIEPLHSFAISGPAFLVPLFVFGGLGIGITWISHRLRRSEEALRECRDKLERRTP